MHSPLWQILGLETSTTRLLRGAVASCLCVSAAILGLLSTNQAQTQTCTPPPGGMVSWWPGDGNANDIQGSNNGTLQNGATFAPGIVGQAFTFDGIDDYVQATDTGLPFGTAARTLDLWMQPGFDARVPVIYGDFAPSDAFYVLVNGGNACIGQWGGGPPGEPCGSTDVTDGNWHHVAMTYDGVSTVLLYVDGALEASVTKTYTTTQTGKVYMGSTVEGSQEYYTGLVDEVEIFNRALSQSEIQAIYGAGSAGKCKTPPYSAKIQQPIHADGTSVFTIKRGVVPVKFTLTQGGVATCVLPSATIALTRTAGGVTGAIDESVYSGSADTGSNFRIDSCQYVYNLSASTLGVGTYRVDITVNGHVVGSATFALK
jgi:concanavalin A-like lectin/glucanase superfamily protein